MGNGKKMAAAFVILLFLSPQFYFSYTLIKNHECYFVLRDILDVQDQREGGFDIIRKASGEYRSGIVGLEEYKEKRSSWLSAENAMASESIALYEKARAQECF
jgi:hypothetical protein